MSDGRSPEKNRALLLLVMGGVSGVALAAWGLLTTDPALGGLPATAVARVNGTLIFTDAYKRLLAGLERDTRQAVSEDMKRRVLDRMIDEEVLVQRGMELGLAESDRRVRADITSAMIRSIVVEAEDRPPEEQELKRFYAEERAFFTQTGRLRVRQVFFRVRRGEQDERSATRAAEARARLVAGASLVEVRKELGDSEISPVPDALLPPAKLREYVGPTALRTVMEMAIDEISEPVRSGTGYHVFVLVDREEERIPDYAEIREQVRNEWVRRAGDRALRGYLDELRERADLILIDELP